MKIEASIKIFYSPEDTNFITIQKEFSSKLGEFNKENIQYWFKSLELDIAKSVLTLTETRKEELTIKLNELLKL